MYNSKDYWIYREFVGERERFCLVRVKDRADRKASEVSVVFEKDKLNPEKRREESVPAAGMYLNLGEKPPIGSVFGVRVEPHLFSKEHENWGQLRYYRRLKKKEKVRLNKALTECYSILESKGLTAWMAELSHLEVREKCGRWAGRYHYRSADKDHIILALDDYLNTKYNKYLILHESAHGVWFRMLDDNDRAEWIDLYTTYANVDTLRAKEAMAILDEWLASDSTIGDYAGQLEEEDANKLWAAWDAVKNKANLDDKSMELLRSTGRQLTKFWPSYSLTQTDMSMPIGEYASTKPEEFFAEAITMHLTGMLHFSYEHSAKMPDKVKALAKKTLKALVR